MVASQEQYTKDWFISYNRSDQDWAEWIAWQLEEAGFSVVIQTWDFRPGSNFVLEMDDAAKSARRTLVVLSQAYLDAVFTHPEWAAAFVHDPRGSAQKLIPVKVGDCKLEGLLQSIVYINISGKDEIESRAKLLEGVRSLRAKPLSPPAFPGASRASRSVTEKPKFPKPMELNALLDSLPTDAKTWSLQHIEVNGTSMVQFCYTQPAEVTIHDMNDSINSRTMDRQYLDIYNWQGSWRKVFNLYDWAQALLPRSDIGPIVDGKPQAGTAVVYPSIRRVADDGHYFSIGDLLVLSLTYMLGPNQVQHSGLTIGVFAWDGTDFNIAWRGEFAVRGSLISTWFEQRGLQITTQAYLSGDGACCPRGWEQVLLKPHSWYKFKLEEVKRCVTEPYGNCF